MNENFKKVMDAIAEMKSMFSTSTEEVPTETAFGEGVLMDGTAIAYEGDLAVGTQVFVVADGEQIPAPEGTHALGGEFEGVSIVTDAGGVVVEIIDERAAEGEAASSEDTPETTAESMSAEQVEAIVLSKMEGFSKAIEGLGEMLHAIASENESLRTEMSAMKTEFEAFKAAPSNSTTEGEKFSRVSSTLTARQLFLKSQINK